MNHSEDLTSIGRGADKLAIPEELPILSIKGSVLFPDMVLPLQIENPSAIKMIDDVVLSHKMVGVVTRKRTEGENANVPPHEASYSYGSVGLILKMVKMPNGGQNLLVQGLKRFKILEFTQKEPYLMAKIYTFPKDKVERNVEMEALISNIQRLFRRVMELSSHLPQELGVLVMNVQDPSNIADLIASNLNLQVEELQEVLETLDISDRLKKITLLLNKEIQVLELGQKIQTEVKSEMDERQREYFLREQLKAIQKELGEKDDQAMDIEELTLKIKEKNLPDEVEKEAVKELNRLARMSPAAAEYNVSRTYIEWILDLPWNESTQDTLDIEPAARILDEDHYDLEKVKKRILEYLAVRKLKSDMKGPVLCFVGPPGVGKTSLGRSIARALNRKFYRISLGGVRDEAEIRGHRRTYVGALPGRIIQGIKRASSNNPVFMLDEIDKIGSDFRGDPSSALLEVLDPEQNFSFSDHYLEVNFDLSKVMFITTANILDTIPPALRDRMEVLELPGYTEDEKIQIAQKYTIPKQLSAHGLQEVQLSFSKEAIREIVKFYTKEAGLRNMEREIATVCRAVAKGIAEGTSQQVVITPEVISKYLGPFRYYPDLAERTSIPGVAVGLAWTPAGGDIIFVEATKMKGGKNLSLTGQLGEIMKESAQTALSYIRSKALELEIDEDFFQNYDIHIHVPAGAIPKDGPSAGVTMFTALTSLLKGLPVRSDLAMSGEITLRGSVLPVGGIKEKVLAANLAGIKTIVLPKKNEKDLEDIPKNIKEALEFKFVQKMDEIIPIAFSANTQG